MSVMEQQATEAFSRQSAHFDAIDEANPIIRWMRQQVYAHLEKHLKPQSNILELNAGTGIDATWLANHGHSVLATDGAEGMVRKMQEKFVVSALTEKCSARLCSFHALSHVDEHGFDHVFSNFGGLNCTGKLGDVARGIDAKLLPGGKVTLVLIAPVCPWEILHALKGNFGLAFRRFKKNGAPAHLEGLHFQSYYYSTRQVQQIFGANYNTIDLQSLGFFTPPPYHETWAKKYPGWLHRFTRMDEKTARWPFIRSKGDHFIITLQKQ